MAGLLQVSSFQHSFNCQLIVFPFELNMQKVNTGSVIIHVHFACCWQAVRLHVDIVVILRTVDSKIRQN